MTKRDVLWLPPGDALIRSSSSMAMAFWASRWGTPEQICTLGVDLSVRKERNMAEGLLAGE